MLATAVLLAGHAYAQVTPTTADPPPTGSASSQPLGTVERVSGSAVIVQLDSSPQLSIGDVVRQGETLRTDSNSRLQIHLLDDSILTIGPQSELKLTGLSLLPNQHTLSLFTLLEGYLRAVIAPLHPDAEFEVRTPSMVAAVRGTEWVERYSNGRTEIFVNHGVVSVSSPPPPPPAKPGPGQPALPPPPPIVQMRVEPGLGVDYGPGGALTPVAPWQPERSADFFDSTTIR